MKPATVFSIFGQIESVIAEAMVAEGKVNRIPPEAIPPTAAFNDRGDRARLAIVLPAKHAAEFERRVAALYA